MSQFAPIDPPPLAPAPIGPSADPDAARQVNQIRTDAAIQRTRRATPQSVIDQRRQPRVTVADLNDMDMADLRERFAQTHELDNRGAFTRLLDTLDLSRNALFNLAFPSIAAQKASEGETGALGLGVVRSSDVLKSLGVNNRIVNGVVGLLGDTVFDPTTYLGGIGLGAKLGRGVVMTKEGTGAIKAGIESMRVGEEIAHPLVRQAVKDAGAQTAEDAERYFFGDLSKQPPRWKKLTGGKGPPVESQFAADVGGSTAGRADEEAARVGSAQALYAQHGAHAAPGIRVGKTVDNVTGAEGPWKVEFGAYKPGGVMAGTGYAHIPFTDYGLFVGAGRNSRAMGYAVTGAAAQAGREAGDLTRPVGDAARTMQDIPIQGRLSHGLIEPMVDEMARTDAHNGELLDEHERLSGGEGWLPGNDTPGLPVNEQRARIDALSKQIMSNIWSMDREESPGLRDEIHDLYSRLHTAGDTAPGNEALLKQIEDTTAQANRDSETIFRRNGALRNQNRLYAKERSELMDSVFGAANAAQAPAKMAAVVGDKVHWTNQGVAQFAEPRTLESIQRAPDGRQYGFVDGSRTGIPVEELDVTGRTPEVKLPASQDASIRMAQIEGQLMENRARQRNILDTIKQNVRETGDGMVAARDAAARAPDDPNLTLPQILRMGDMAKAAQADHLAAMAHLGSARAELRGDKGYRALREAHSRNLADLVNADVDEQRSMAAASGLPFDEANAREFAAQRQRNSYAKTQADSVKQWLRESDETALAREKKVDSLQQLARAEGLKAQAMRGPLVQTQSSENRIAAEMAKSIMGLGPDVMGQPVLAGMRSVADAIVDRSVGIQAHGVVSAGRAAQGVVADAASWLTRNFNNKSGSLFRIQRDLAKSQNLRDSGVAHDVAMAIYGDVLKATGGNRAVLEDSLSAVRQMMENGGKDINDLDIADIDALKGLHRNGTLNEGINPGLFQGLQEVASKWQGHLGSLADEDVRRGFLNDRLAEYFPHEPTYEALTRMRNQLDNKVLLKQATPEEARVLGQLNDRFQKPRSMIEYKWTQKSPEGQDVERSFLEGHRVFKALSENDLGAMGEMGRREAQKYRDLIDEYDAMGNAAPKGRYLSVDEINRRAQAGEFHMLFGGPLNGSFMEQNPALALASRFARSDRQALAQQFKDAVRGTAVLMDAKPVGDVQWGAGGASFRLKDSGATGRLEDSGRSLWIGNQRYRQLDPKIVDSEYSPLHDLYGDIKESGITRSFYPERVADMVESHHKLFSDPNTAERFLRGMDGFTKYWKVFTLGHPSWPIVNVVGHASLALTMPGIVENIGSFMGRLPQALKIVLMHQHGDADGLENLAVDLGGRKANGASMIRYPVQGASIGAEALTQALANGQYITPTVHRILSKEFLLHPVDTAAAAGREMSANGAALANAAAESSALARQPWIKKINAVKGAVVNEGLLRRLWGPFVRADAIAADTVRTAAYMTLVEQGHTAEEAAQMISDHMLDMNTLTRSERNIRSLVPFWTWLKNSAVFGVRQMLDNPKFFTIAPHVKHALEEAINGEGNLPEHLRPSWVRDQMGMQIGADPENRTYLTLANMLPQDAAVYFANGLGSPVLGWGAMQDALHYWGNSLNPLVKTPLEIGSGREWYTGRTISAKPDEGDLTPEEYILNQIRPFKEFGVGNVREGPVQAAFGKSPVQGVERLVAGGRLQPMNEERRRFNLLREFKDQEASIRKRINLAEREGNHKASLQARAHLLKLYSAMRKAGVGDAVPKKLAAQEAALSGGRT